jgi:hypothetical protein
MAKKCTECGDKMIGRQDKKFCSAQCRSSYNNKLNSDANNFMRNVNNILRRNRRILIDLNPTGKSKVHKDKLVEMGFSFNYFTNVYRTKKGNVYYFCYEYGYLMLDSGYCSLVIKQEYVT